MDRSGLIKLLEQQAKEINLIIKGLENNQPLHRIDIDVLLSKIRDLYEESYLLFTIDEGSLKSREEKVTTQTPDQKEEDIAILPTPVKKQPEAEPVPSPAQKPTSSADGLNPFLNPLFDTPITFVNIDEESPIKQKTIQEEPRKPIKEPDSQFEDFAKQKEPIPKPTTQHEVPSGSKKASSVNEMPITDLLDAIGLNDRFWFTRELFSNNPELFKATLSHLNKAGSFENALKYLDEQFKFDVNDPVVKSFLALVERRYLTK